MGKTGEKIMALKNKIKFYRKNKSISQQKLAVKIGILRTTLSKIENGKLMPSAGLMVKISQVLQEPLGKIFFVEGVEQNDTGIKKPTGTDNN